MAHVLGRYFAVFCLHSFQPMLRLDCCLLPPALKFGGHSTVTLMLSEKVQPSLCSLEAGLVHPVSSINQCLLSLRLAVVNFVYSVVFYPLRGMKLADRLSGWFMMVGTFTWNIGRVWTAEVCPAPGSHQTRSSVWRFVLVATVPTVREKGLFDISYPYLLIIILQ